MRKSLRPSLLGTIASTAIGLGGCATDSNTSIYFSGELPQNRIPYYEAGSSSDGELSHMTLELDIERPGIPIDGNPDIIAVFERKHPDKITGEFFRMTLGLYGNSDDKTSQLFRKATFKDPERFPLYGMYSPSLVRDIGRENVDYLLRTQFPSQTQWIEAEFSPEYLKSLKLESTEQAFDSPYASFRAIPTIGRYLGNKKEE